jgi:hypothetical protein
MDARDVPVVQQQSLSVCRVCPVGPVNCWFGVEAEKTLGIAAVCLYACCRIPGKATAIVCRPGLAQISAFP